MTSASTVEPGSGRAPRIAFLGLGQMGRAMAQNLAAAKFAVTVWNRTARRAEELTDVMVATTPVEAVAGADIVVSMLADDAAVRAALFDGDALDAMPPDALHISMSTISLELCDELASRHEKGGHAFLAAPVFGRVPAAAAGNLWIIAGGARAHVARAAEVFDVLGRGTFALDTPQQAALAKIAGNFLIAATIEALGETVTLGEKGGIAPERLFAILQGTLFGSVVVDGYGEAIAARRYQPPLFAMPLGLKDVKLAQSAAMANDVQLPLADLTASRLETALARGRGDFDWVALVSVIREDAGLPA